jgi:hypothetical protein
VRARVSDKVEGVYLERAFREDSVGEADDGANGDAGRGRRVGSGDGAVDVVEGQAARRVLSRQKI